MHWVYLTNSAWWVSPFLRDLVVLCEEMHKMIVQWGWNVIRAKDLARVLLTIPIHRTIQVREDLPRQQGPQLSGSRRDRDDPVFGSGRGRSVRHRPVAALPEHHVPARIRGSARIDLHRRRRSAVPRLGVCSQRLQVLNPSLSFRIITLIGLCWLSGWNRCLVIDPAI